MVIHRRLTGGKVSDKPQHLSNKCKLLCILARKMYRKEKQQKNKKTELLS